VIPHGMEVYVALDAIDRRWGFDRLAGLVTERLGRRAGSGALLCPSDGGAPH
jgi:transposase